MHARFAATFALVLGIGLVAAGCGSSHRSAPFVPTQSTTTSGQETQAVAGFNQTTELTSTAVQSVMAQVDPVNFSASADSVAGLSTSSGGSASGAIQFDFGSGRTIGNTTFAGSFALTYNVAGGSGTIVLTFTNLSVSSPAGSVVVAGTLTCTLTINGSRATAVSAGNLVTTVGGVTTSLTSGFVYDLDGPTGRVDVSGAGTLIHSQAGAYSAALAGVTTQVVGGQRAITAGTVTLTRTLPFPVVAIYQFTSANAGTFTITPGISGSFSF